MQNDWQQLGYKHGEDGKSAETLNRFVKDCAEHGVTPDAGAYSVGYKAGIALYCTAENGSKVGSDGRNYSGACPAELEKPFLENYLDGLRLAMDELQVEYNWDALELNRLRATRASLTNLGDDRYFENYYYIGDGRIGLILNRLSRNISRRSSINNSIREWSGRI